MPVAQRHARAKLQVDQAMRMIKQWALWGTTLDSKKDHRNVWRDVEDVVKNGTLAESDALDNEVLKYSGFPKKGACGPAAPAAIGKSIVIPGATSLSSGAVGAASSSGASGSSLIR